MRKLLLLAALGLGAGVAQADNDAVYVGAGVSRDNIKDIAATNSDLNSTNWKVWAGFRPVSLFAVEADYIDLGSQNTSTSGIDTSNSTHIDFKAFAGYAVGYLPIPDPILDVFVKAGVARWNSSGSTQNTVLPLPPGSFFSLSDHGTQFAWGIGAQVHFGYFGARLEYENFDIRNTNGANIISLTGFVNFL